MFPVLALIAVVVFACSALISLALSLLIPIALLGLAAASAVRNPFAAYRLARSGFASVKMSARYTRDVFRCIAHPLADETRELDDTRFPRIFVRLKPPLLIELHRLQQQVAEAVGQRPADEFWISPGTELGVGEEQGHRFLVIGLSFIRMLSADELRAALAHEFGHARAGHLRLGRFVHHSMRMLVHARLRFRWFDPAAWGAAISFALLRMIYLPWSRAREFEADRISAQVAGGKKSIAALRKVRDLGPSVGAALEQVLSNATQSGERPLRLSETVLALATQFPPALRRRLSVISEGDPFDLGGRTHPPTAIRIARLEGIEAMKTLPDAPFPATERLSQLDERLTPIWLAPLAARRTERPQPPETIPLPRKLSRPELEAPTSDGLELDLDRTWKPE